MYPRFSLRLAAAVALLSCPVMGRSAEAPSPAPMLHSTAWAFDSLPVVPTGLGQLRRVADNPTATFDRFECHITTLNPGNTSHLPHRHAREELIILREGTLDVFINGKIQRVGPGSMFFFASNDLHNVTNVGTTPATYFVFNVATGATAHVPEKPAAESAPPQDLRSTVIDWTKLAVKTTKTGERRDVVNSPTVTCANLEAHVTTLRPGEVPHPRHHHPDEEIVLVKDGKMEATFNGTAHRGGPGSIFFYASNEEHGMKNVGAVPATYYVIRIVTAATPKAPTT